MPQGKGERTRGRARQSHREAKENEKHSSRRMRSIEGEAKVLNHIMRRRIHDSERAQTSNMIRTRAHINGAKQFSLWATTSK
eukprot:6737881-Heterocapsa_arctica.AAC.1